MEFDNLALRTAKTFVDSYTREDVGMEQHKHAMDCRDCEAFLQLGIDAFDWVIRADQLTRQAMFDGAADFDHGKVDDSIRLLCRAWLGPCDRAEQWVALQHSRNFKVDNLERFRTCCAEMQAIVRAQDAEDEELPEVMAQLRDKAIEEHRDGQTAEFF